MAQPGSDRPGKFQRFDLADAPHPLTTNDQTFSCLARKHLAHVFA
jgi:hypothetical protein